MATSGPTKVTPKSTKVTPEPTKVTPEPTKVAPKPTKHPPKPTKVTEKPTKVTPSVSPSARPPGSTTESGSSSVQEITYTLILTLAVLFFMVCD